MARARMQSLFNLIDGIKYTKSTMGDDHCTAQRSHKFVHVCTCLGAFLFFVMLHIKIFGPYACEKKLNRPVGVFNKPLPPKNPSFSPQRLKWLDESCLP